MCHAGLGCLSGQTFGGSPHEDARSQTREVLARIAAFLVETGSGRDRLLSAVVLLEDTADSAAITIIAAGG